MHCIRLARHFVHSGSLFCPDAPCFCPCLSHCRPATACCTLFLHYARRQLRRSSVDAAHLTAGALRLRLSRCVASHCLCGRAFAWPGARRVRNARQQNAPATSNQLPTSVQSQRVSPASDPDALLACICGYMGGFGHYREPAFLPHAYSMSGVMGVTAGMRVPAPHRVGRRAVAKLASCFTFI